MFEFKLLPLPYAPNALEPAIDAKTMEIHHGKHHNAYVTNLNNALKDEKNKAFAMVQSLEELFQNESALKVPALRNNAGGHWNHTFFWNILKKNSPISEKMLGMINKDFSSMDNFKAEFKAKALSVFGSGWVWLCYKEGKLHLFSTPNQDNPLMCINEYQNAGKPVLGLDVWEHAYYLKYQNLRASYIDAFFEVIHWEQVEKHIFS